MEDISDRTLRRCSIDYIYIYIYMSDVQERRGVIIVSIYIYDNFITTTEFRPSRQ